MPKVGVTADYINSKKTSLTVTYSTTAFGTVTNTYVKMERFKINSFNTFTAHQLTDDTIENVPSLRLNSIEGILNLTQPEIVFLEQLRNPNTTQVAQWGLSQSYFVNNIIQNNTVWYICTVSHTSSSTNEPGVGASWESFWDVTPTDNTLGLLPTVKLDLVYPSFSGNTTTLTFSAQLMKFDYDDDSISIIKAAFSFQATESVTVGES